MALTGQPVQGAPRGGTAGAVQPSTPGAVRESAPDTADNAAIQAQASQLRVQYQADPAALLASAQSALAAGRNDATIALFLKLRWAGRLTAALERYGVMLAPGDLLQLSLAAAGVQHYGAQLHEGLMRDAPSQLIVLSLHAQRLTAYDSGRVVVDTLVTTGRPSLATDVGAMKVIRKDSPWTMHSPWPAGSAAWYPDTAVRMVVWFTETAEGFHDASWQPDSTLGPGSQNGPFASHGCVHVPLAAVTTLFQWAPIGTPVVVYPGDGSPVDNQRAQQTIDMAGNPTSSVRGD
jgi:hypothetical protein